jgi:hypothetical protein
MDRSWKGYSEKIVCSYTRAPLRAQAPAAPQAGRRPPASPLAALHPPTPRSPSLVARLSARGMEPRGLVRLNGAIYRKGLFQRRPGKREKSASFEWSSA